MRGDLYIKKKNNMKKDILICKEHKVFTCEHPKNNFIIDNSNGYPVVLTTNVDKNTKWLDILKGNYKSIVDDGTPEYLCIDGEKYTYIDYKYAIKAGYMFVSSYDHSISPYKSKLKNKFEYLMKKVFYE